MIHSTSQTWRALLPLTLALGTFGTAVSQDAPPPAAPYTAPTTTAPSRNVALDRGVLFEPVEGTAPGGNAGLFIGVNEFTKDTTLGGLQFAVHDAIEQAYLFVFELHLIRPRNCFLLLSGQPVSPQVRQHLRRLTDEGALVTTADRSEILVQLNTISLIGRKPTDLLVCAVSSHGFIDGRKPYVMPSDGLKNLLQLTAVPLDSLELVMDQSQAGHRLLFVDACQERISARTVGGQPPPGHGMDAAFREAFEKPTGQYKLASCSAKELSYENSKLGDVGHGVFTHALLEALRGGAAVDSENLVRLSAVEEYVSTFVTKWSTDAKLPAQTPFSAGARSSRKLPLAKKADDLATLAASVRKQSASGGFTADLRDSLAMTLVQLDLRKEEDRELVSFTRNFVNGVFPANAFVPYLRAELDRRQTRPSPQFVRASFTVREGDDDNSPWAAGVRVELQWQASGSSALEMLGMATTDDQGRARIELKVGALPTSSGRYLARVSKGASRRDWTLTDFPTTSAWRLYLPRSGARLGDVTTSPGGMNLASIPAGQFWMGSNETAEELEAAGIAPGFVDISDESPRHLVKITRPFQLGVHEVTIGQFAKFVADTGHRTEAEVDGQGGWGYDSESQSSKQDPKYSWRNTGWVQSDDHPVVNVTWKDAVWYCNWLSRREGKSECFRIGEEFVWEVSGSGYRLPREAEWEYACRAGTSTRFGADDRPSSLKGFANVRDASNERVVPPRDPRKYLGFTFDDRWPFTSPVGEFTANAWGLHDMHGNVYEWCSDWYGVDYYRSAPAADPFGPTTGTQIVVRGGAWGCEPGCCRTANRGNVAPAYRNYDLGFRVAIAPASEK